MSSINRRLPKSNLSRELAIRQAHNKMSLVNPADMPLLANTQTRLSAMETDYANAMSAVALAQANLSTNTPQKDGAIARLRTFVSHFIQVFNLGVAREKYPAAHRSFYMLDVSSSALPDLNAENSVLLWGNRLTDDVLIAAIAKPQSSTKTPFFTQAQVRDILLANAPNTMPVIQAARERQWSLDDYLSPILAAQDSPATGRLDTMKQVYRLEHYKSTIYNERIRTALADTVALDLSLIIDTLEMETFNTWKAKLTELYLMEDDTTNAAALLAELPLHNEELRQYKNITGLYIDLRGQNKQWYEADSTTIDELWQISETNTKAAQEAKSLLTFLADTIFEELIEPIEIPNQFRKAYFEEAQAPVQEKLAESIIKIYPNPANNELVIYKGITDEAADFILYDMYGKLQITTILEKDKAETAISLGNLNSGAYIYVINQKETKLHQGRLIVIK